MIIWEIDFVDKEANHHLNLRVLETEHYPQEEVQEALDLLLFLPLSSLNLTAQKVKT